MKREIRQQLSSMFDTAYIAGMNDPYDYVFDPTTHRAVMKERARVVKIAMQRLEKVLTPATIGKAKPAGKGKKK